jgi:nitrate/TMAO reductase-like tetraheme cytochrome c subunit/mono/diheme cytochrome c family protein
VKRFWSRLKQFFFPPAGSPRWARVLPYAVLGALTLVILTAGAFGWEYTNSPGFCGATCHTMPPEYTAYLTSPHARIDCVDCHIGKGFIATRITRKAGDLRHVFATAFKTYEFPIRAKVLRPARETCEKCHFPEKFSDDSLREIKQFTPDKGNTPTTLYLVLKTGGGSQRQGLGRGIHWHIENQIEYLTLDPEEQAIPYVRVLEEDGSITEYVDVDQGLDPATINPADLKVMDCITCHNRITHLVETPGDTVDQLMDRGILSPEIPDIRRIALEAYSQLYDSTELGLNKIAGIASYYQTYHPDYFAANQELIAAGIAALQDAYRNSVFPQQNSDWTTHPNNIGHKDSPGCFRCHDGKHLNGDQEAIRLECNLCHSIPVVAGPQDFVAEVEISRGPEPETHKNPNWIGLHRDVFDQSCSNCHSVENPGGTENVSFCSNSACHGRAWDYAGFDAPALREVLLSQIPPAPTPTAPPIGAELNYQDSIGPLFQERCGACHSGPGGIQGLDLTSYAGVLKGGASGPAIIAGDPEMSLIIVKQSSEQSHFGQLTPEELDLVVQWITAGAPEE